MPFHHKPSKRLLEQLIEKGLICRKDCPHNLKYVDQSLLHLNKQAAIQSHFRQQYEEAIQTCNQVLAAAPDYRDCWGDPREFRATAYASLGEYEKAVTDFSYLIDQAGPAPSPNAGKGLSWILFNRARCYLHLDQCQSALQDLGTAMTYAPNQDYHYFCRAKVYEKLGQQRLADMDMEQARLLHNDND
jgi:tetratricopeptide (TPR) repeat protein